MRFWRKERYRMQPPMTSLIDIVFLLLIYFLLTTNFIVEEGINVKLPDAKASAPRVKQELTVVVDRGGVTYIAGRKIPDTALFKELKFLIVSDTDRLVVIKADKKVILNKAVRVMDIAKAAGASRLSLATEKGL